MMPSRLEENTYIKYHQTSIRKVTISLLVLLGVILSPLGASTTPAVLAQEVPTSTSTTAASATNEQPAIVQGPDESSGAIPF